MAIKPITKVLIVNRGEIALRVIRTCKDLQVKTVAVFSTPDRTGPHVLHADEAYHIGPAPSSESYLNIDKILEVAEASGADAIHPGYGFLSENADFAEACENAGITFIGPSASAIRSMGDKTAARALMEKAGVPMAPGTTDAVKNAEEGQRVAEQIGFPVLIKAAAGGGGKGMRIVSSSDEFAGAMRTAQSEARSAFGDDRVFIEKYILNPRHIEFQILADSHGNTIHLFERECSIQRRHQKVVEEAPSAVLSEQLRTTMGNAAIAAAETVDYTGVGTVEFLVDDDRNFYFMEMNTRLQVEHPVTELVTGIDLVEEQLRVAEGHPLRYRQDDISLNGHSIECRVYAEDPSNNFLPDPGHLYRHSPPMGPGVRVDSGIEEGDDVLMHYDPMISKLVTWGSDRDQAIRRMVRALDEYQISGVSTTIPFCRFVMTHADFVAGDFSTHFVQTSFNADELFASSTEQLDTVAALAAVINPGQSNGSSNGGGADDGKQTVTSIKPSSRWTNRIVRR